jgi:hypothetical protein
LPQPKVASTPNATNAINATNIPKPDDDANDEYLNMADDNDDDFTESAEQDYEKYTGKPGFTTSDPSLASPPPPRPLPAGAAQAAPDLPVLPPRAPSAPFDGDDLELKREIRKLLRAEGIQLWEAPYSLDDGNSSLPADLADRYASELVADPERTFDVLENLRISSRKKQKLSIPAAGVPNRKYAEPVKAASTPE